MNSSTDELIQIPFCRLNEARKSSRYHWDNSQRGIDPFVIVQYAHQGEGMLLRTTNLPVAEVAIRSGWTSATKFDLFFKRRYRVSPQDYRRSRRSSRFEIALALRTK